MVMELFDQVKKGRRGWNGEIIPFGSAAWDSKIGARRVWPLASTVERRCIGGTRQDYAYHSIMTETPWILSRTMWNNGLGIALQSTGGQLHWELHFHFAADTGMM